MHKRSLSEKLRLAKQIPFSLPPGVTMQKTLLPEGCWAYIFRHAQLGELGRLRILPHGNQSQFVCEVSGSPNDPMTVKRQEILEPITQELIAKMVSILGQGTGTPVPYSPKPQSHQIKFEMMPCEQCGIPVACLISAPGVFTVDGLEDYARLTYVKVQELKIPTWIIGAEKEVNINGDLAGKALTLKIWPDREEAKIISSLELNPKLDELMKKHCDSEKTIPL